MIIQHGLRGIEGLSFISTDEVTMLASATMYTRQRWSVEDTLFNTYSPNWLTTTLEWLGERTPAMKRTKLLQVLAQQSLLNSELVEKQEARLDLTHSIEPAGVAVDSLRYYQNFVERMHTKSPLEDRISTQPTVDLARDLVAQIDAASNTAYTYTLDPLYQ